jgi:hypothetical protein
MLVALLTVPHGTVRTDSGESQEISQGALSDDHAVLQRTNHLQLREGVSHVICAHTMRGVGNVPCPS